MKDVEIQALVELLARRAPNALAELRERFPEFADRLQPGKRLGDRERAGALNGEVEAFLVALAHETVEHATAECSAAYVRVGDRIRKTARYRLGGALTSSISSCGLIAALMADATEAAIVVGTLTFVSSTFTLIAQYHQDAGGQTSLSTVRERVVQHMAEATRLTGELKLMEAKRSFAGIDELIRQLNVIQSATQHVLL